MTEQSAPNSKKPIYTITAEALENAGWVRHNVEARGNGRITMGAPETQVEVPLKNGNTLNVGLVKSAPGSLDDPTFPNGYPYELVQITGAYIETPDGEQFAPPDLEARIEIEDHRRMWVGAFVSNELIASSDAERRYGLRPGTIRQAINRAEENGVAPAWARKQAGVWMVLSSEADKRWGKK